MLHLADNTLHDFHPFAPVRLLKAAAAFGITTARFNHCQRPFIQRAECEVELDQRSELRIVIAIVEKIVHAVPLAIVWLDLWQCANVLVRVKVKLLVA